jgi:hypothetical protein
MARIPGPRHFAQRSVARSGSMHAMQATVWSHGAYSAQRARLIVHELGFHPVEE